MQNIAKNWAFQRVTSEDDRQQSYHIDNGTNYQFGVHTFLPASGSTDSVVHGVLPQHDALDIQRSGAADSMALYMPDTNDIDTSVQALSRMVAAETALKRGTISALCNIYRKLFRMLLYHECPPYTTLYVEHSGGGFGNTDIWSNNKPLVEDFHTYSSNRRNNRSLVGFFTNLRI